MSLVQFIVVACVLCLVLWLFETQIPAPAWVKTVVRVVVVLVVILWLLSLIGLGSVRVG